MDLTCSKETCCRNFPNKCDTCRADSNLDNRYPCYKERDMVEVVRCKDCKYFIPKHIKLDDGTTRAYTEEEKRLPLGVSGDVGINCGSRCMRHLYWEENSIPFWFQENDFCSYGERKGAK